MIRILPKDKFHGSNKRRASGSSGQPLFADLDLNLLWLQTELGNSPDLTVRRLTSPNNPSIRIALVFIDGLVDAHIIAHLMSESLIPELREMSPTGGASELLRLFLEQNLATGSVNQVVQLEQIFGSISEGKAVILLDGLTIALTAEASGGEKRAVEEPTSQTVVRGPKESFTESIRTNTSLLRRRIKSPALRIQVKKIGTQTQTDIAIVYLQGIANDLIVQEIQNRLDSINTDSILESGYIEEFIQDATFTPFPTIQNTERPDAAASSILEGQIAILVDGTPFVLIAPVTFFKFFQSSEDYYQRYDISTFLRIIRYVAFLVSMLLPSLYIAITTFHQEMLPTTLLVSLAAQREGIPFPAIIEALIMEITFEVLREAGVRMPRVIGPAISIVGALVLGQAAVQAGLVSAAMVIVVSFTAIANFVIPSINMAIAARLIRFVMMFFAATLGLFGIMSGLMILLIHMAGLRSFGIPYLMPLAPLIASNLKDVFIRFPWWAMIKRPRFIASGNMQRQSGNQQPKPPDDRLLE
ncbi:spore germination protein [Paenibacillus filicis]|uniref:Spore germination protein n=1 Tax=Paenibacillus gyeongsangnamensis TaxID=3388067 RepID=A0ABT4Q7Q5_9BACL|nr:spore germination protein [Paenibacillus filicis]MCZ8512866.1 spore germination protein [Paenibacillus filicis]